MALAAGRNLGSYKILGPLGAGGMGEVYRASQSSLGRQVAIKVLAVEFVAHPNRLHRFEQEARAASALNHPNIISIYDVGRDGELRFIAMEFVDGKTLRAIIESGPLSLKRALQIAAQLAEGLAAAHGVAIVHRDLKPENVMVTRQGFVKILDFGLAKLAPEPEGESANAATAASLGTNPGVVVGTVGYMSPEQARGIAVDFRSDIFSFGAVFYEMLTGKRPFKGASHAQTLAAIIEDDPTAISEVNPKVPAPVRWVVDRCLAKNPEERYASTRDLARDLAVLRNHFSDAGNDSASSIQARGGSHSRRSVVLGIAILAGVLAGLGLASWLLPRAVRDAPIVRNLTFSGDDFAPSVSPDGRTVAFVSHRDEGSRIWLKQLESGSESALTSGPSDLSPRFSPDGSWVAFARANAVYRISSLGGDPRKLVDDAYDPDWSPDGKSIVFLRNTHQGGNLVQLVGVASAQDGSFKIIHSFTNLSLSAASWSPDGSIIALIPAPAGSVGKSARKIYLLSADGTQVRVLESPASGGFLSAIAWSGSGQEMIYSQPESAASGAAGSGGIGSNARVYLHSVNTGKARVLLTTQAQSSRVDVASPGRLVFDSITQRSNLREILFQPQAGEPIEHWLTHGFTVDRQPYYSPDGSSVTFSSSRSGDIDLWEVSTKTSALRRLTDHPAADWDPSVTPDGKHLVWSSNRSGNFEIWAADRDGSTPHQVSNDGYDAENPITTPDGWIVYVSANPQHLGLWKVRADGSQATLIVPGPVAWPDVTRDGQFALYHILTADGETSIHVVRLTDGSKLDFESRGTRAHFSGDGKSIIYISLEGSVEQRFTEWYKAQLVSKPFPSSRGVSVKVLVPVIPEYWLETFAISPDGTRAVISYAQNSRSLMMADGIEGIIPPKRK